MRVPVHGSGPCAVIHRRTNMIDINVHNAQARLRRALDQDVRRHLCECIQRLPVVFSASRTTAKGAADMLEIEMINAGEFYKARYDAIPISLQSTPGLEHISGHWWVEGISRIMFGPDTRMRLVFLRAASVVQVQP